MIQLPLYTFVPSHATSYVSSGNQSAGLYQASFAASHSWMQLRCFVNSMASCQGIREASEEEPGLAASHAVDMSFIWSGW